MSQQPSPPQEPGSETSPSPTRNGGRRGLMVGGVLAVLALILGVVYALTAQQQQTAGGDPTTGGYPTTVVSTTTSTPADSTKSGEASPDASASPTVSPTPAIPEMSPDKPGSEATQENDIVVTLTKSESVQGEARLPGEIAGPAIRVTITVQNKSAASHNLEYTRVTAYYGADRTPAGVLTSPGGAPLDGTLAAGATATGVYVFGVPTEARNDVTVTVDTAAGVPMAVFTGRMG